MNSQNSSNDIYSKEVTVGRRQWSLWLIFAVFLVTFLMGVGVLYRFWLNPWIVAVKADRGDSVNVPGVKETDQDKDGLSLEMESKLGTSDNMKDTDNDELDDAEEIKIGTNPTQTDSDHDGFKDGLEVKTGHNPLGI